jgi:hypothetical protein
MSSVAIYKKYKLYNNNILYSSPNHSENLGWPNSRHIGFEQDIIVYITKL